MKAEAVGIVVLCVLSACAEADAPSFPPPSELPAQSEPPALLVSRSGEAIASEADWSNRRQELLDLFAHYVYGYSPAAEPTESERVAEAELVQGAHYEEFELRSGPARISLALFRPPGTEATPVILALNKCGNQSVSTDERVRLTTSGLVTACNGDAAETVGGRAESWPIEDIVARGFTLATFHESDIRIDGSEEEGIAALIPVDAPEEARWGALAQWAWGLQRAVDFLVGDARIDAERIVVTGHSRRGKAALWAGAQDPRIAVVAPHQSGTGGATMARGGTGEPLFIITTIFGYWFAPNYTGFADDIERLPVDQHLLLALVAPRGLVSTNGEDDSWADPPGALRAVRLASPAWELNGAEGLVEVDGVPTFDGSISWHNRDGAHSLEPRDWTTFLDFADAHFGR